MLFSPPLLRKLKGVRSPGSGTGVKTKYQNKRCSQLPCYLGDHRGCRSCVPGTGSRDQCSIYYFTNSVLIIFVGNNKQYYLIPYKYQPLLVIIIIYYYHYYFCLAQSQKLLGARHLVSSPGSPRSFQMKHLGERLCPGLQEHGLGNPGPRVLPDRRLWVG